MSVDDVTKREFRRELVLLLLELLIEGGYGVLLGAALGLACLVRALQVLGA